MKLNQNSISSKLYRWFYGTNDLPNNLCPYFWKLVLAWLVLIPYSLVGLPSIIMEVYDKDYKYNDVSTGKRIGIGALCYILLFFIFCMLSFIGWFFVLPTKGSFYAFAGSIGIFVWIGAIVIGIIEGCREFNEWNYRRKIKYDENGYRIWNEPKEKKNLFGGRICQSKIQQVLSKD
jgi:hypothetical protein